jgi:hypothetical protein
VTTLYALSSQRRHSQTRKPENRAHGWIIYLSLALFSLSSGAAETGTVSSRYIALALQGDVSQASLLFDKLAPPSEFDLDHELAKQFQHRFILRDEDGQPTSGSAFIDQLLAAYRQYWTQSMMGELPASEGSEWLDNSLYKLHKNHNYISILENTDDIYASLENAIGQQGFYSDFSFSSPWRDLVLWKTEQRKSFLIELTDRQQAVDVVFMDDFHSLGWSEFATLGMTSTGGWAKKDLLYCVTWAWDQASEHFRVSFLQHEGRHVADFELFPKMHAIDLEYRAKLTELAFASTTLPRILKKFTDNGSANQDSPHAFANYRVSRDLYRALFGSAMPESGNPWLRVGADKVNPAARILLDKHTRLLEKEGALVTTGVIYQQNL